MGFLLPLQAVSINLQHYLWISWRGDETGEPPVTHSFCLSSVSFFNRVIAMQARNRRMRRSIYDALFDFLVCICDSSNVL